MLQRGASAVHLADEGDVDHTPEFLDAHVHEAREDPGKGVVYPQVDAAETVGDLIGGALKDAAGIQEAEAKQYEFVLSNAIDAVDSGADDHRKLLAEEEEAAKHKKKKASP